MSILNALLAAGALAAGQPHADEAARQGAETPVIRPVEVEILHRDVVIWRGALRIAPGNAASFQLSTRETYWAGCVGERVRINRAADNRLSLQLMEANGQVTDRPPLQVQFEWTRPSGDIQVDDAGCLIAGPDMLTARIQSDIALPPGRRVTLRGDGDIVINLKRR